MRIEAGAVAAILLLLTGGEEGCRVWGRFDREEGEVKAVGR